MRKDQRQTQVPDLGEIDWKTCPGIERDPERMSGAWCFKKTRITVASLFENLASGTTVKEYLEQFPDAGSERVAGILEFQAERLKAVWKQ